MKVISLEMPDDEILIGIEAVERDTYNMNTDIVDFRKTERRTKGLNKPNILKLSTEQLFSSITAFSNVAEEKMKGTNASEVEIEFGVVCSIESGTGVSMLISSSAESTIKVRVKWDKEDLRCDS